MLGLIRSGAPPGAEPPQKEPEAGGAIPTQNAGAQELDLLPILSGGDEGKASSGRPGKVAAVPAGTAAIGILGQPLMAALGDANPILADAWQYSSIPSNSPASLQIRGQTSSPGLLADPQIWPMPGYPAPGTPPIGATLGNAGAQIVSDETVAAQELAVSLQDPVAGTTTKAAHLAAASTRSDGVPTTSLETKLPETSSGFTSASPAQTPKGGALTELSDAFASTQALIIEQRQISAEPRVLGRDGLPSAADGGSTSGGRAPFTAPAMPAAESRRGRSSISKDVSPAKAGESSGARAGESSSLETASEASPRGIQASAKPDTLIGIEPDQQTEIEPEPGIGNAQRVVPKAAEFDSERVELAAVKDPLTQRRVGDILKQLAERIEMLAAKPREAMVIRLEPLDLGKITLTVRSSDSRVDAQITATNEHVRNALEQNVGQLGLLLEQKGLTLSQLDVRAQTTADGNARDAHRQQASAHQRSPAKAPQQDVQPHAGRSQTGLDFWI